MNKDPEVIKSFGEEWERFDQSDLSEAELQILFKKYFNIFPWDLLPKNAQGFDMGCGSGRWAKLVAPRVGKLYCIDPSEKALNVAKRLLSAHKNIKFYLASVDNCPLSSSSMDFGYSLGVLHHIPDTLAGLKSCIEKLKVGAPFLIYLYYALENRPWWFRGIFKISNLLRKIISDLPQAQKNIFCQIIAFLVYLPCARVALFLERLGLNVQNFPLAFYRDKSLYVMQTDALDRFGTKLEKRFTRQQIQELLEQAGLEKVTFSESEPFWCAIGIKKTLSI
jgi:SAM-dependent methyltransferase